MNTDPAVLTIAIPTYNRAAKLRAQLERLVPQLRDEVRLCIYDNASTDETQEIVSCYLAQNVSYFRAVVNCGAARNFSRCFEECQTEWLWMLGDDDPVSEAAVDNLLPLLRQQSCDFIHTSTRESTYGENTVVSDVASIFRYTTFSALLWISAGIYRIPSFRPLFQLFNDSASTCCGQSLIVLSLVESRGGKVLLSTTEVLARVQPGVCRWSTLDCLFRNSQAPEYLARPDSQEVLASCILSQWFAGSLLLGLREATQPESIRKWQRIRRLSYMNLKAYRAQGCREYFFHNWFRAGHRKKSFSIIFYAALVEILGWCPIFAFHHLIKLLPLPQTVRNEYNKRKKYVPSC